MVRLPVTSSTGRTAVVGLLGAAALLLCRNCGRLRRAKRERLAVFSGGLGLRRLVGPAGVVDTSG